MKAPGPDSSDKRDHGRGSRRILKRAFGGTEGPKGPRPVAPKEPAAKAPVEEVDYDDPALFINRELSLLEFNRRVLAQARDRDNPLLERLRFLTICSTNLDEFFEIRAAGLQRREQYQLSQPGADRMSVDEALRRVSETAHELVSEQYRVLNEELLPELESEGIRILKRSEWSREQAEWIRELFESAVLPVLTPVGLDPSHPFPRVLNKGLSFIVSVEGEDAFGRSSGYAIVQVPRSLPRLSRIRSEGSGPDELVLLSSIIHAHVEELFPGMVVSGCYQFRLTRDSELWVDEEEVDNLLQALEGELPGRRFGESVRLEVDANCSEEISRFLLKQVGLHTRDLYRVEGLVNLYRLSAVYGMVDRPELKFPPFNPGLPAAFRKSKSVFEVLRRQDVLLHHPYESFAPVIQFMEQAAADPDVLAIKQTVYRTDAESPLVESLIRAARAGKEVTAVIELRARFDEAANIALATRLEEAGANVVYGVVGYKTHAKLILVVRREDGGLKRYVHMGTGNYHSGTAKAYTDFGLLTSHPDVGEDAHRIFMQLTGLGEASDLKVLLQAPFTLQSTLTKLIEDEIRAAEAGRPAWIVAKMNSLSEPGIIRTLYRASRAGVRIDLIVRGICCLRPGVPGYSENIRVRSIVGRFLEHPRVFYFFAEGEEKVYCSSADFMSRNFFRRIETAFPILEPELKRRVIQETLELYLADNHQAWSLQSDGSYVRLEAGTEEPRPAQRALMAHLGDLSRDQSDSGLPLQGHLFIHIGPGQRVGVEPPLREDDFQALRLRQELDRSESTGTPPPVQPDSQAQ